MSRRGETAIDRIGYHIENRAMARPKKTEVGNEKPKRYAQIGWRLQTTREALGLSRADLCTAIKCKQPRWSQYETGERKITGTVAERLCDTYDLSLDWIYRGKMALLPGWLLEKLHGRAN
jgi:ribosome-binding protein aMBF1 (putative translation factor)